MNDYDHLEQIKPMLTEMDNYESLDMKTTKQTFKRKVVLTLVFFATWINLGLVNCVISATLPDWLARLHVDFKLYGRMVLVSSIFATCGVLAGGILRDHFAKHTLLIMAILQIGLGAANIALPFSINEYVATVLLTLKTLSFNMTNIVGSTFIVSLWGESANLPIHFLHMGYPIGCTLAPLISRPFLSGGSNDVLSNVSSSSNVSSRENSSRIEVPYSVGGITTLASVIVYMILYCNRNNLESSNVSDKYDKNACSDLCNPNKYAFGRPRFGIFMTFMLFAYYSLLVALEASIANQFLFTYTVKSHYRFSHAKAAYFDAAFKGAFLLGRIISVPVAHYVNIKVMQSVEIIGITIISFILMIWGTGNEAVLWIASCSFNFMISPLWPGGYAWFDSYIILNSTLLSICDIFRQSSNGFTSWIAGYFLDTNSDALMSLLFGGCCCLFVLFLIGQIVGFINGERTYKSTEELIEMLNDDS